MVDQRSTILNYLSPVLIPRPRIRDHVNYTLRSSCLRFLATVIPYQRQNSRRNEALSKEKLKGPYSAKWRTFLWRIKLEREKKI